MTRFYFTVDEIAEALDNAGFELRPEDQLSTKFNALGEELAKKARRHMQRELENVAQEMGK